MISIYNTKSLSHHFRIQRKDIKGLNMNKKHNLKYHLRIFYDLFTYIKMYNI